MAQELLPYAAYPKTAARVLRVMAYAVTKPVSATEVVEACTPPLQTAQRCVCDRCGWAMGCFNAACYIDEEATALVAAQDAEERAAMAEHVLGA